MSGLRGAKKVLANLAKASDDLKEGLAASLYAEGQAIIAESVKQVPVDTGRLRQSHYAAPPKDSPRGPSVQIGYGTDYAVAVHERTEVSHSEPTKAKYLEGPVNAAKRGYASRIARRAWRFFKQGIGVKSIPATAPKRPRR
jgi:hypothetical protein